MRATQEHMMGWKHCSAVALAAVAAVAIGLAPALPQAKKVDC
jgi:hypothetical protein